MRERSAKSDPVPDARHRTSRDAPRPAPLRAGLMAVVLGCAFACGGAGGAARAPPRPDAQPESGAGTTARTAGRGDAAARTLVPERYRAAARYSEERGGLSLVVLEGNRVVVETGQNGHEADAPQALNEATESFWGVLAAAAVQDGVLELDELVKATLPEFAEDPWKRNVRVRQLLDFTSGLESGVRGLLRDPAPDRYARALTLEMVALPGERFQYGPSHLFVFGALLARKRPDGAADPLDYLTRRIFDRIGVRVDGWSRDEAGNPDLPTGAVLRPREWAKFGLLIRDRGRWRGESVIDADALDACFVGSAHQPRFGLAIWLNVPDGPDAPAPRSVAADARGADVFFPNGLEDLVVAAGSGNQRLYVIPSADLVVVRFGVPDRDWRDREFLALVMAGREPPAPAPVPTSAGAGPEPHRVSGEAHEGAGAAAYP